MQRKPWCVAIHEYKPSGPGAAGRWPRTTAHVFESEDAMRQFINQHVGFPGRWSFCVFGDPREVGAPIDDLSAASDAVYFHPEPRVTDAVQPL